MSYGKLLANRNRQGVANGTQSQSMATAKVQDYPR